MHRGFVQIHYKHRGKTMTNWVEETAKELANHRLHVDEKVAIKVFLQKAAGKDEAETWYLAHKLLDTLIDLWNIRVQQ